MTRGGINIHHSQRFKPTSAISLKFSNHSVRDHKFINPYEAKSTNDVQVLDTNYSQSCFQRHFSHQPPCCSLIFFPVFVRHDEFRGNARYRANFVVSHATCLTLLYLGKQSHKRSVRVLWTF